MQGKGRIMDGIVIFVASNHSRAIIWCSDHQALGLARRNAMPSRDEPPLQVGEHVRFEPIDEAGTRLCGKLHRASAARLEPLPALLQRDSAARQRRSGLTVISGARPGAPTLPLEAVTG